MADSPSYRVESPEPEPGFNSFEAAVAASSRTPRAAAAKATTQSIKDRVILGMAYSDQQVDLFLDNGLVLSFFLDGDATHWQLGPEPRRHGPTLLPAGPIQLVWPTLADPSRWDRDALMRKIKGVKVFNLHAGFVWTFLSLPNGEDLFLDRLKFAELEQDILYWDLT